MVDPPVIDAHAHVLSPRLRALGIMPSGARTPATGGGPNDYLGLLRAHSVRGAIVIGLVGDDDYLWDAFDEREAPRIWRVLTVEENPSSAVVKRTVQRLSRPGVLGVRLRRLGPPGSHRPMDLRVFPILRALAANRLALWILMDADQHHVLRHVLEELPDLTGVLNHMGAVPGRQGGTVDGRPRLERPTGERQRQLAELAAHRQVAVILSGQYAISDEISPYRDLRAHTEFLLEEFGADRLMWGSDHPLVGTPEAYREQLDWVRRALPGLSENEVAAIMGGNACRLTSRYASRTRPCIERGESPQ